MMQDALLDKWAYQIARAARSGVIGPVAIRAYRPIAGPRAGAVEFSAGFESGKLLRALQKDDCAALRQTLPWEFVGSPVAFFSGRYVRVEAGWPAGLAKTTVRLRDINQRPQKKGRWCIGVNERGATIIGMLNDHTPQFLVSGATGGGKTIGLQSALFQLGQDTENQIVLMDGKYGSGLRVGEHLPAVVGPTAIDGPDVRGALTWLAQKMRDRYEHPGQPGRVIGIFDEFQPFMEDQGTCDLIHKIASQGRGAGVHLILATHHPTVEMFGRAATRRSFVGKIAFRVEDQTASRVAIGDNTPRADWLLGKGDAYAVSPSSAQRVQGAYLSPREFERIKGSVKTEIDWQSFSASDIGQDLPVSSKRPMPTVEELAKAVLSAAADEGRPSFRSRFESPPGGSRAPWLLDLGRGIWKTIKDSEEISAFCDRLTD